MDDNSNMQAVVAGHICLDITPGLINTSNKELGEIISPGRMVTLSGVNISTGWVIQV
jgi:hypothetical protein